ncbi:MAG: hypothetical protein SVS85_04550 [Candidatus Nanohaloarchaea archaeon]|nr:hypothetical protein [Candidatus Nanohaloarchaea archaeon]
MDRKGMEMGTIVKLAIVLAGLAVTLAVIMTQKQAVIDAIGRRIM